MFRAVALSFSPAKGDTPVRLELKKKKSLLYLIVKYTYPMAKKLMLLPKVSEDADRPVKERDRELNRYIRKYL